MEWWKAFGTYSVQHRVIDIYGAEDRVILDLYRQGLSFSEVLKATQTVIQYQPYRYGRTEYFYPQPPLYIYTIFLSTSIYREFDPDLTNDRVFNFFLNLQPVISSALLTLVIFFFVKSLLGRGLAGLAALFYWLNPLVILNSPIQAFLDPLLALFAVCSVIFLFRKRLSWAYVFLALAALYKPQGVIIAPIIVWMGLREHNILANLRAWLAAGFTGVLATAMAFAVQNTVQTWTTATHTALILAAEPVFAVLFGYLLAGERLTEWALVGCGLILAGMLLAELRPVTGQRSSHLHRGKETTP